MSRVQLAHVDTDTFKHSLVALDIIQKQVIELILMWSLTSPPDPLVHRKNKVEEHDREADESTVI